MQLILFIDRQLEMISHVIGGCDVGLVHLKNDPFSKQLSLRKYLKQWQRGVPLSILVLKVMVVI